MKQLAREKNTHQLILVCCHSNEICLWKGEGFHLLGLEINYRSCVVTFTNNMHSRLVFMHRVKNELQCSKTKANH